MAGRQQPGNRNLGTRLAIAAAAMFAFGFALVPLYDIFCEITGIRIPIEAADIADITEQPEASRSVTLLLIANTNNNAPWEFHPVNDSVVVQTGLLQDTEFYARNLSNMALDGIATPDVRPAEAGKYLQKVECFCFSEQHFEAGEERWLPVRFFIKPELPAHIDTITLSYTLFAKQKVTSIN
jgi:cytochrome c oxidase assembly protein subunit 11